MKRIILSIVGLCCLFMISLAQNYTISGSVTDVQTGETLISSTVFDALSRKGTAANLYGFYSLTLPKGEVQIRYSYIGYAPYSIRFDLSKDTVINVGLHENANLQEVTIIGNRKETGVQASQMSAIAVPVAQIKAIPIIFGENDMIKALQLLPGVQAGTEGFTGFYVRGGGPDENLFLLDGVPIYNINHLGGFFSVFNSDAVKNVTLYKGGFPARFGSRLSSVLDVRMNDGNNQKLHGNISIGLISSKISLEGPLFSEKTTFNISARRTYFDILSRPLIKSAASSQGLGNSTAGYYFYDLNAKVNHKFSDNDRLYVSFYMGDDATHINVEQNGIYLGTDETTGQQREETKTDRLKMNWDWGNLLTVVRWNHILTNKLFMNTTATYTRYRSRLTVGQLSSYSSADSPDREINLTYQSGIEDFSGKIDWDYAPNPNHDVKLGIDYIRHIFRPGIFVVNQKEGETVPTDTVVGDTNIASHEMAVYLEDNFNLGRFVKINAGVRYSSFFVQKQFYRSLQPRLSIRTLINEDFSLKAAYSYMSQYIHLLSNNTISMPTDLWIPVTKQILPMQSHQIAAGAFYNLNNWVELSLEAYYKTMNNVIEYKDGANFIGSSTGWEEKVNVGKGWAYGVEILAQKTIGKTTGWIGYTWSKTDRLFDRPGEELNFGQVFPAKYDRRHDVNIVITHKFNDRIDVSATWVYSTGSCATLGLQDYYGPPIPGFNSSYREDTQALGYITQRNNYRNPNYHRMDLGANFHKQKKRGTRTWSIGIYNAYNRMNPFFVYPQTQQYYENGQYRERKVLKQITLFPIIPSIGYSYSF